jgi:3-dehydroquinate synthetase
MRHGDAVALGMVAAFRVARARGIGEERDEARAEALLRALGLPTDVAGRGTAEVGALLGADKKREGGDVRFIAPGAPGEVTITPIALDELRAIVAAI